jgi:hypothetical protein
MRWLAIIIAVLGAASARAALPIGSSPAPIELRHFPSRMHALVFRNWNLVEVRRIAEVLQTTAENIAIVAESMGLPPQRGIPPEYRQRLYISIIKRNWHLLSYDQLLVLLDMSEDQLAHTLREDDFLWSKLGMLKPKCERITYAEPTEEQRRRAAQIKTHIRRHFPDFDQAPVEPPLAFLGQFEKTIADGDVRPSRAATGELRYLYSYFAVFGDPLLDPTLDPFPDGLLQRYADLGVAGVWLHVVLRDLAPPTADFPEFGKDHQTRLTNLGKLVARAKRFGIGVYLYMNEPRAMPAGFFKNRPDVRGTAEGDYCALCTSQSAVRQWLGSSLSHVFKQVPDLAGVFTITASENFTNCASHNNHRGCPRCKDRSAATIIAEVNGTIEQAVHSAAPNANVIIWDWGWPDVLAGKIIEGLPTGDRTWLQSVSEWSLPIERGGTRVSVGEYSISAVGPGPRATRHWQLARSRGVKTVAKVQVNNTWELSAVPYLPTIELSADHAVNLAKANVDGVMMSWSLGGYPSPNLEAFGRLMRKDAPSKDQVLDDIARRIFGAEGAAHARKAWSMYADAFKEFPYDGGVIYSAPLQAGPANLLYPKRTGYAATMVGLPYDDLTRWRGPYPVDTFISQLEKVAKGFEAAEAHLENAARTDVGKKELRLARAARLHFASVAAQAKFVRARDGGSINELRDLAQVEADHAKALYGLQRQDSRIGFEASNHYYYFPQDLIEKHLNCHHVLSSPFPAGDG